MLKIICIIIIVIFLPGNTALVSHAEARVQDIGEELVIVIDPGHGGVNEGTIENGFQEKSMNLITAQAMYEELIQYDNVEVYMTRTDDRDMSLKERAEFAASAEADFLFSLHYNASANHTLYGTEIWISAQTPYNAYGYQFGYSYLKEMQGKGLFLRGIKTKLNDKGSDYYGIIREAAALEIPAVILEHCHVDEPNDVPFCETEEDWISFGKADALAVAKYFGLSSESLGVDYSRDSLLLPYAEEDAFVQSTYRDETKPDVCSISLADVNYDTGEVVIDVTAADYDSFLLYYDYSIDGGETYIRMLPWPGTDLLEGACSDTFTLALQIPSGTRPEITVRAYNFADLYSESNSLSLEPFLYGENSVDASHEGAASEGTRDHDDMTFAPANGESQAEKEVSLFTFLKLSLVIVILLFFAVLVSQSILYHKRKKRRRQRIKELENSRNQPR